MGRMMLMGDDDLGDDDLGDDEDEMGDDDDTFLGGPPKKRKRSKGSKFSQVQPGKQDLVLPFPNTTVAAGVTTTVTQRPQRPMQCQRAAWGSQTAPFFRVTQFLAGMDNFMNAAGGFTAELFSTSAFGTRLRGYIVYPGIDLTLTVTNIHTAPHDVDFSIIGATLV